MLSRYLAHEGMSNMLHICGHLLQQCSVAHTAVQQLVVKLSLPGSRVGLERIGLDVRGGRGIARASVMADAGTEPTIAEEKTYVLLNLV